MFIDNLKELVITITTMLVFISAIEIIAPNNKMKKYIDFILGLILIAVILNPIVQFVSKGEESIINTISKCEELYKSENKEDDKVLTFNKEKSENNITVEKTFIQNFNKNCEMLLKKEFHDMNFKCDVKCDINFDKMSYDIKSLKIGVSDNSIRKIKKIEIGNQDDNKGEVNEKYQDVIEFISSELNIPKDKIEVYKAQSKK